MEEENKKTISDAELEALLMPYARKGRVLSVLTALDVLCILAFMVILWFDMMERLPAGIALAVLMAGVWVLGSISSANKKQYDRIFREHMGEELERTISGYFGPQLEPALREMKDLGAIRAVEARKKEEIRNTGMFPFLESCELNSYRKGNWKGMTFEGFNAKINRDIKEESEPDRAEAARTHETVFDGFWLVCETKKEVSAPVLVRECPKKERVPFWNVELENAEFNDRFAVHSEDPHMAYYLLTPQFMETILKLDDKVDAKTQICFRGKKVYFAFDSDRKFLDMNGADNRHIENLRQNLKQSLNTTAELLDLLLENTHLFG